MGSCLKTAYLFSYATGYSAEFGAVFGVYIVGVGWLKTMLIWFKILFSTELSSLFHML